MESSIIRLYTAFKGQPEPSTNLYRGAMLKWHEPRNTPCILFWRKNFYKWNERWARSTLKAYLYFRILIFKPYTYISIFLFLTYILIFSPFLWSRSVGFATFWLFGSGSAEKILIQGLWLFVFVKKSVNLKTIFMTKKNWILN